ncbi:MAG: FGGY family carbohydrate kinase [Actinomycetaceae bacterium]|nr:FGGY family carbohydrate kinase [Actinomycetaceae bacterium]
MSVLAVDLGTSGVRCAAYSNQGEHLYTASRKTDLKHHGKTYVDISPNSYQQAVIGCIKEVAAHAGNDEPQALSCAVQGEAALFTSDDFQPLTSIPVSMDRRGVDECDKFASRGLEEQFCRVTGQALHPMYTIFRVPKLREEIRYPTSVHNDQTLRFLTLDAWFLATLGVEPATDWTLASRTGLFNVEKHAWDEDLLALVGLGESQLPEVFAPGSEVGNIRGRFLQELGLKAPIKVIVGSHDQACAFWGLGGTLNGTVIYSMGSSDCITQGSPTRPQLQRDTGFASYPFQANGWLTLAGTAAGGWAGEWMANTLYSHDGNAMKHMIETCCSIPSEVLVLPYHCGTGTLDNNAQAQGIISGLTLTTTPSDLARAALEASGYEANRILETSKGSLPLVTQIRAAGGGASPLSAQLRAEALGRTLQLTEEKASLRGAAIQALVGLGEYASLIDRTIPHIQYVQYEPTEDTRQLYERKRRAYSLLASTSIAQAHIKNPERNHHERIP